METTFVTTRNGFFTRKTKVFIVLNIITLFCIFCLVVGKIADDKANVSYKGWNTKITPSVYKSVTTGKVAYIILYKKDKSSKLGYKELKVSLENSENLKFFQNFLNHGSYEGLGNYIR